MHKLTFAILCLVCVTPVRSAAPVCVLPPLAAASVIIEYNATDDLAALVVEAESDQSIARFLLFAPDGSSLLDLAGPVGLGLSLSGLRLESEDRQLASLQQDYPEGIYQMHALAGAGGRMRGNATLSHALLAPVVMGFPDDGDAGVPTTGLLLSWTGSASADGYEVALEQGESDGLRIRLPPGSTSFHVPDGYLAPATETTLEIAAIASNGNRTITVIEFTTQ